MNQLSTLLLLAAVPGVALVAVMRAVHVVRKARRHHTRANRRFMAGYRAGYRAAAPRDRRTG